MNLYKIKKTEISTVLKNINFSLILATLCILFCHTHSTPSPQYLQINTQVIQLTQEFAITERMHKRSLQLTNYFDELCKGFNLDNCAKFQKEVSDEIEKIPRHRPYNKIHHAVSTLESERRTIFIELQTYFRYIFQYAFISVTIPTNTPALSRIDLASTTRDLPSKISDYMHVLNKQIQLVMPIDKVKTQTAHTTQLDHILIKHRRLPVTLTVVLQLSLQLLPHNTIESKLEMLQMKMCELQTKLTDYRNTCTDNTAETNITLQILTSHLPISLKQELINQERNILANIMHYVYVLN